MPLHGFRAKISRLAAGILTLKNRFRGRRLALLPALFSIASCFSADESDFAEPCCEDSALPGMEVILPPYSPEYMPIIAQSVFARNGTRGSDVKLSIIVKESAINNQVWAWAVFPPMVILVPFGLPVGIYSETISVEAKIVRPHGSDKIYSATVTGSATEGFWFWNYELYAQHAMHASKYRAFRNSLLKIHEQMEKDATEIRRLTQR
jgi:hypothetical protein